MTSAIHHSLVCRVSVSYREKISQTGSLHIIRSVNVFRKLQKYIPMKISNNKELHTTLEGYIIFTKFILMPCAWFCQLVKKDQHQTRLNYLAGMLRV